MALVHNDEVEEVLGELLINVVLLLGAGDGLVEAEVDLEGLVHRAVRDLRHGGAEGLEVIRLRLVGQDVPIHEEEDALLRARLPQSPDDLEGGVGLPGARGHDEQEAVLPACDGIHRSVDGDELVVARCLAGAVVVVVLGDDADLLRFNSFRGAVTLPEFLRRGELIERNLPLHHARRPRAVMLQKGIAIRAVGKGQVKNLRILQCLRHPRADSVVVVLRLNDG